MKHHGVCIPAKRKKPNLEMKSAIILKTDKKKHVIKTPICRKKTSKKNINIESATKDTIAETIAFVIQGQLTPIKPTPLPVDKIGKHNVVSGTKDKQGAVKKIQNEKTKTKVQNKTTAIPKIIKTIKKTSPRKTTNLKNVSPVISQASKNSSGEQKTRNTNKKKIVKGPTQIIKPRSTKIKEPKILKKNINNKILEKRRQMNRNTPVLQKSSILKKGKKGDKIKPESQLEENNEIKKQLEQVKVKQEKLDEYEFPATVKKELETPESPEPIVVKDLPKKGIKSETDKDVKSEEKFKKISKPKNKKTPIKQQRKKMVLLKKKALVAKKTNNQADEKRRAKLLQFWNSPKRHRVASLNAIAKVHCLYENESKAVFDKIAENAIIKKEPVSHEKDICDLSDDTAYINKKYYSDSDDSDSDNIPVQRTLRNVPGLRAVGKHWDMHDSISSDNGSDVEIRVPIPTKKPLKTKKEPVPSKSKKTENLKLKKPTMEKQKRRRKEKPDVFMDLKDMVVKKRMASLNASAILAASYSSDKRMDRPNRSPNSSSYDSDSSAEEYFAAGEQIDLTRDIKEDIIKEEDNLIEVHTTPNKKVAVILNQDTDVTITGVYVNSTTRSTHHEGYCSIAGMQYRISATSHTQTAATAVATETLLQSSGSSDNTNSDGQQSCSSKSYTPLDALSTMQPPAGPGIHNNPTTGHHRLPCQTMPPHQLSPPPHRQKQSSAFSSPHHSSGRYPPPSSQGPSGEQSAGYAPHGYYQPAGPLISMTHTHGQSPLQQPPLPKSVPLSDTSPSSVTSPVHQPHPPPASSSNNGDSSDNEVIITSVTAGTKDLPHPSTHQPVTSYRYPQYSQYPPYSYPPQYHYPTPPPPTPPYAHHEMCYSVAPPAGYVRHAKYAAPNPSYHRYPYYTHGSDLYPPSSGQTAPASQQVVTASPVPSGGSYQSAPGGPLPPPTIMETYPPPPAPPTMVETYQPPPHYYPPSYGLPPNCYSHSPTRAISYINAAYQPCPCPLNTCPKNGHTGPLTGESKRSNISKDSMPLPPVALALPLEPASATGPPSPARGSAGMPSGGMPPPPSPAGASYQMPAAPTPKQESHSPEATECKVEKRKARVGKAMVRSNMQNTMLLMCNPTQDFVKREIESPKDKEELHKKEGEMMIGKSEKEEVKVPEASTTVMCTKDNSEETQKEPMECDESKSIQINHIDRLAEKTEDHKPKEVETETVNRIPSPVPKEEPLPPCIATVAENVKVKNMKRKQSLTKQQVPDVTVPPPTKKKKLSSYKDFIRKHTSCFKISNSKRKLVSKASNKSQRSKIKLKSPNKKRLNASKEQTNNRRMKKTPLKESNSGQKHNSKTAKRHASRNNKSKSALKTAAKLLDNLIAKNNIDKVIEEVISKSMRTNSELTKEKCKKETKKMGEKINKLVKNECKKIGACRRKSTTKCKTTEIGGESTGKGQKKGQANPKWSNGWTWEGEPYEGSVFLNSDETTVVRRCYPAMRHQEGDIIRPGHCVLLKAGPRKNDLPYVAKIAALWENPDDGEMMMSLLWYYRPEHTEQGRLPTDQPDEVFASRHKDSNSVACIDDKCYVLTFNEYCRYKKNFKRLEEGLEEKQMCIPTPAPYPRSNKQPPASNISPDMVFFCRKVYDFRQKRIIKNPT